MASSKRWERVGDVGVDSGTLWIGDPCYVLPADKVKAPGRDWAAFVREVSPALEDPKKGVYFFNVEGAAIQTGVGDGCYDVYVKRWHTGEIAEVRVVFISDDPEEAPDGD